MKHILAATDGSEGADRAIAFAADLARAQQAELLIATIIGGFDLPGGVFAHLSLPQNAWFGEMLMAHAADILTAARAHALRLGAPSVQIATARSDSVVTALRELADEKKIDAIVIGRCGVGKMDLPILGSVAHKLVSIANCAVIVVP